MVNSQVIHEIVDALKIDERVEPIPNAIPTIEVGYKRNSSGVMLLSTRATSGTMYINPATGYDFYITSINFNFAKDAACDAATGTMTITAVPYDTGVSQIIFAVPHITLTASEYTGTITFANPLRLLRNSQIQQAQTYAAGTLSRTINISGFYDKTSD